MNYTILASMLCGFSQTYKVTSLSVTGNYNSLSFVPGITLVGGSPTTTATAVFTYTTNAAYSSNAGTSYIDSLNEGIGVYATPASGNVVMNGSVVGTYTTSLQSVPTGGGVINSVTLNSGGSGYTYPPPVNGLMNGTYSLTLFYNNDPSNGAEATVNGTFTGGVLTSVSGLSVNTSGSMTTYTVYPTSAYGYIQSASSYATLSFTRTAITYTSYTIVNSTTVTYAYAGGNMGYSYYFYNGGWPVATFGSGTSRSGYSNSVSIQSGVSGTNTNNYPATYNLTGTTVTNTGAGYTSPPSVSFVMPGGANLVGTAIMTLE
jgi:hypothetical protein